MMLSLIEDLYHLNRNFCSQDYDKSLEYLKKKIPFDILSFDSSCIYNGWEIPPKWDLIKATIRFENKVIFEAKHPLEVIGLSKPFQGILSLEKLQKHLHYDHRYDKAIPYHFRQNYRPWERTWGFCVTKEFYNSLKEGLYEVCIQTQESKGYLKVAEYHIEGMYPECFAFVAHLDHPGMANDDLAGVAVACELFKRLKKRKNKFSYKLLLLPEIIGSEYYLHKKTDFIIESCFLEMLGSDTQLALQASSKANSNLEYYLEKSLKQKNISYRKGAFKSIICNDEAVWESRGIPMSSLSRFPYPQYHCSLDNPSIIHKASLEESLEIVENATKMLEKSNLVVKKFSGFPCLSHPKYNLYIDPGQKAFGTEKNLKVKNKRLLMDLIPSLEKPISTKQLASQVSLEESEVLSYLKKWEERKLLTIK